MSKKIASVRAFPLWATVFTGIGVVLLCSLGVWQLQRLHWKTALLDTMAAETAQDPMAFELMRDALSRLEKEGRASVRGFAEGAYLHGHAIALGPRTRDGQPGYHIITPFETLDNTVILVNRGWVPLSMKETGYATPDGGTIITGTARLPQAPSRFVPRNDPAKEAWYRLDPATIAAAKGLQDVSPYVLYLDEEDVPGAYPKADALTIQPPNNHLHYAVFWFSMAGVLLIIYGLRFLRPGRTT